MHQICLYPKRYLVTVMFTQSFGLKYHCFFYIMNLILVSETLSFKSNDKQVSGRKANLLNHFMCHELTNGYVLLD